MEMYLFRSAAAAVTEVDGKARVDYKSPDLVVVMEVMKAYCCLAVIPRYFALKKFNVIEIAQAKSAEIQEDTAVIKTAQVNESEAEIKGVEERQGDLSADDASIQAGESAAQDKEDELQSGEHNSKESSG